MAFVIVEPLPLVITGSLIDSVETVVIMFASAVVIIPSGFNLTADISATVPVPLSVN